MRIANIIERREGLLDYLKQQFPNWPNYVVKDFLYANAKNLSSREEIIQWIADIKKEMGHISWQLEKIPLTLDAFTPETQNRLLKRKGGTANPFSVPNDSQRHQIQAQLISQKGVSSEPIIVIKTNAGYDLIEGWHRTIQHLRLYPNGFKGIAWVGVSN